MVDRGRGGETLVDGESLVGLLETRSVDVAVVGVFASLIVVRNRWWHAIAFLILSTGPIGWLSRSLG